MASAMHTPQINSNGLTSFDYPEGLLYMFSQIEPSLYLVVTAIVPFSQLSKKQNGVQSANEIGPREDF